MRQKIVLPGVMFAVLMLLLNLLGLYDLVMSLSLNEAYFVSQGYGDEARRYFTGFPFVFTALWFLSHCSGVVTPVLFFMKHRFIEVAAFTAAVSHALLLVLTVLFRGRIGAFGITGLFFDLSLLALLVLFYVYCRQLHRQWIAETASRHVRTHV